MSNLDDVNELEKHGVPSGIGQSLFIVLVVLAVVGVFITNISPADAHGYWLLMIAVFGAAAIFCGWKQSKGNGTNMREVLLKQVIHWIGTLVAILCVYTFLHTGRINFEEAGLIMLLVLALATFLAGSQAGWRFYILGALLIVATVVAAYIEEFMWVILLLAIAIVGLTYVWSKRRANV